MKTIIGDMPSRATDIQWNIIGSETIVYHPLSKQYYILNGIAGRMWQLADGTRTAEQIAVALSNEYDVGNSEALQDVITTLTGLADFGLVN